MKKFVLVHEWKYGEEVYLIECNSTERGIEDNIHSVCEILGIDYTEDHEEYISIHEMEDKIPQIIL